MRIVSILKEVIDGFDKLPTEIIGEFGETQSMIVHYKDIFTLRTRIIELLQDKIKYDLEMRKTKNAR